MRGLKAELARALGDKAEVVSFRLTMRTKYRVNVADFSESAVAGVGQAMPFKNGTFEVVLMLHVAEHIDTVALEKIIQKSPAYYR